MIPLFTGIFLLFAFAGKAQLVDITRAKSYLAVFSQTGDFDSSYLTVLEKRYTSALTDILMPAIGNELAWYCGCRKGHHYNHSL